MLLTHSRVIRTLINNVMGNKKDHSMKIIADNTSLMIIIIIILRQLNHVCEMKQVQLEFNHNPMQKAQTQVDVVTMLQQPLLQLYLISSCDSTAIAFKQDGLCFYVLISYYQTFSESGETAIVSRKNCHNFITERLLKKHVFYFDPCILSRLLVVRPKSQLCQLSTYFGNRETDRKPDSSNPLLCLRGRGLMMYMNLYMYL